jgi:F-box-like
MSSNNNTNVRVLIAKHLAEVAILAAVPQFSTALQLRDWMSSITNTMGHVQENVLHLYRDHTFAILYGGTHFHSLPDEIIAYILEFVLSESPLLLRMYLSFYFRQVCRQWNSIILSHPYFMQPVFLNMWSGLLPPVGLQSCSLDLLWFVTPSKPCLLNVRNLERIFSHVAATVRSFHLVFDPNGVPTPNSKIVRALNLHLESPTFLGLRHLELTHVPEHVHIPSLARFPHLHSLEILASNFPVTLPGSNISLKHLYLQDFPVHFSPVDIDGNEVPHFLSVFLGAKHLESLRMRNVYYHPSVAIPFAFPLESLPPSLERIDVNVYGHRSSHFVLDLLDRATTTLKFLNIELRDNENMYSSQYSASGFIFKLSKMVRSEPQHISFSC